MSEKIPTQQFLEIEQIRNSVLVLRNKTIRGVLLVSSVNFALKSLEEQESIIYQFQNFLNSLDFSCQIVCQSRKLNITGYIDKVKELEKNQTNQLLKIQTEDYRNFIEELIESQNIIVKNFFVVIPYSSIEATGLNVPRKNQQAELTEKVFNRCKDQLMQRMEFVAMGLKRCGLQSMPLTTVELIELFWSTHHPKEAEFGYYPEIPEELIN